MRILALVLSLLLVSCRAQTDSPAENPATDKTKLQALSVKRDFYRALLPTVQGEAGFIEAEKCDSLLFSSLLAGGSSGYSIKVQEAEGEPGQWFRRPLSLPECYASKASRSTISRDQLLGVMWYAWKTGNKQIIIDLWEYGQSKNWVMGKDDIGGGHTLFHPILPLLARIRYAQAENGWDTPARLLPLPSQYDTDKVGFEAHLQVLQLWLDSQVRSSDSPDASSRLAEQAAREPRNPLFQWAVNNEKGAVDILLDDSLWPMNTLPSTDNRCPPWILERDSQEWVPCDNIGKVHSGGDFLFVADLILDTKKDQL